MKLARSLCQQPYAYLHQTKPELRSSQTQTTSFRPNLLDLARTVHKLRRIRLWNNLPRLRLLHKVLVPLLFREADCVALALEVNARALHGVRARLPAHQRVLPAVALGHNVPVHLPVVLVPVAGLLGGFGGFVDAVVRIRNGQLERGCIGLSLPDCASLQINGGAGKNGGGDRAVVFAAIHYSERYWRERPNRRRWSDHEMTIYRNLGLLENICCIRCCVVLSHGVIGQVPSALRRFHASFSLLANHR